MLRKENLFTLCAWILLACGIHLLLVSKGAIHNSDVLFLEELTRDLFERHGQWQDWKFPAATGYVPDVLFYAAAHFLMPSTPLRIYFVTVCQILLQAWLLLWLLRCIEPRASNMLRTSVIALLAFVTAVAAYSGMMLHYITSNSHVSSLTLALASTALFLSFLERKRGPKVLGLVLIIGSAQASDAVYCLCFLVPAFALAIFALIGSGMFFPLRRQRNSILQALLILAGGSLAGVGLEYGLTYHDSFLDTRMPLTLAAIQNSYSIFKTETIGGFDFSNVMVSLFSLLLLSAFVYLLAKATLAAKLLKSGSGFEREEWWKEHWRTHLVAALLCFSLPANLFGSILSGGAVDPASYRLYSFPIALILMLALVLVSRERNRLRTIPAWIARSCLAFPFVLALAIRATVDAPPLLVPDIEHSSIWTAQMARCLRSIEREGITLKDGVGHYWMARGVTELLPNQQPILAIGPDLQPFFWMTSLGSLRRPDRYPRTYNFAIVPDPAQTVPDNEAMQAMGKNMPPGYAIHTCPDTQFQVLVYDNGALDQLIHLNNERFLYALTVKNFWKHATFKGAAMPSSTGRIESTMRIATAPENKAGYLTFGPHFTMKKGEYRVTLHYSAHSDAAGKAGNWDILARFGEPMETKTLHTEILDDAAQTATTIIVVPQGGYRLVELRAYFSGHGRLAVESYEVKKID